MSNSHLLVTGCGRSGTSYAKVLLNALGYTCEHERSVRPQGFVGWQGRAAETSWFAPPYIADLPEGTFVVHQVRQPASVIASFYRIGFFGDGPWRTVLANPRRTASYLRYPTRLRRRIQELEAQRGVVSRHTSVFDEPDELLRCYRYWFEWNSLLERALDASGHEHVRCRLEDFTAPFLHGVLTRLDRPAPSVDEIAATMRAIPPANQMPEYRERSIDWRPFEAVEGLTEMVERYGYGPVAPSPVSS